MAKKTKRQLAAIGTKADPNKTADPRQRDAAPTTQGEDRKPWYLPALDPDRLTDAERMTRRLFVTAQALLVFVAVAPLASLAMMAGGASATSFQAMIDANPTASVVMLIACAQAASVYLLHLAYGHYEKGDAGHAMANVALLLCAEAMLRNPLGVTAMAILLWRVWRRGADALGPWRRGRGFGGVLLDVAGSMGVVALSALCLFAGMRLGM